MKKMLKIAISVFIFGISVSATAAQDLGDLGSSSGIFRSSNPKIATKSSPKTAPKSSPKIISKKNNAPKQSAKYAKPVRASVAKSSRGKIRSNDGGRKSENTVIAADNQKTSVKKSGDETEINDVIITVGKEKNSTNDELYEAALEDGNYSRDRREYVLSEKYYLKAQKLKPKDSRAIYGLGNIYSDQQRWEEAEKAYRQAIVLEPESPEAYLALSFVLTQPVVGVNISERIAEAEKSARKAIELDGKNAVAYDQLGVALEMGGRIDSQTREAYERAIKLDSGFALAYAHLGRLLRRNGFADKSTAAYRDAVRLASDVPTMILVADVMQSQQRFFESEPLLQRALREDPKNPTALFLLGRALTVRANYDEAEKLLKRSVEVSPNSFVSYIQLASLYARRGKFTDAERILNRSLSVVSANEKKRLSLEFKNVGDGFARIGRKGDADRVYRQAEILGEEKKNN